MEHFPIVCSRSKRVKELNIVDNKEQINVGTLTHMWGHFNSKMTRSHWSSPPLESNSVQPYENIAEPLFKEFVKHKYSQIVCQFLTKPNDEKGITFIKNKDRDYRSGRVICEECYKNCSVFECQNKNCK